MSKVVKKIFFAWNMDKEKVFLEEMALKGFKLVKVSLGKYKFVEIEPTKLIYQFDFRIVSKKNREEYLSFFEDWELVSNFGAWFYFVKEQSGEELNQSIFSNKKSQRELYKRLLGFLMLAGFPLYYQIFFMFPNMSVDDLTFPRFYFFFRIVAILFTGLHLIACLKVLSIYIKLGKSIVE